MKIDVYLDCNDNLLESSHRFIRLGRDWAILDSEISFTFLQIKSKTKKLFAFDEEHSIDDKDNKVTIPLANIKPSTYSFYVDDNPILGHIQLPPTLPNNLSPDDIILQTNCSKWMGSSNILDWIDQIKYIKQSSYNMIHWTPLQERGASNSPYSLRDHLSLDKQIIPGPNQGLTLKEVVKKWEVEEGVLSMIDLVWNHISPDSPLLLQRGDEIAYNPLSNSPHLEPAYVLDKALQDFSSSPNLPPIRNEVDIYLLLKNFTDNHLPQLKLWEFWVVDVQYELDKVSKLIMANDPIDLNNPTTMSNNKKLKIDCGNGKRGSRTVVNALEFFIEKKTQKSNILKEYKILLDQINLPIYQELDECIQRMLKNLFSRIFYERLDPQGPLLGEKISLASPLAQPYFTTIKGTQKVYANNGWIWDGNPLHNFAEPVTGSDKHFNHKLSEVTSTTSTVTAMPSLKCPYLNREVIIWSDCVKLNFSLISQKKLENLKNPKFDLSRLNDDGEEMPFLWEWMSTYTTEMVSIFPAIRIDNCHSTPLPLSRFLLWRARKINPNLWVVAELFTSSEERDWTFVTELGINSLIREVMAFSNWTDLLGGLGEHYRKTSYKPHTLLMDCTHDNEMVTEKFSPLHTLPFALLASLSPCAVGSTRGFDEIIKEKLNIVSDVGSFGCSLDNIDNTDGVGLFNTGIAGKIRRFLADLHHSVKDLTDFSITLKNGLIIVKRFSSKQCFVAIININGSPYEYPLPVEPLMVHSITLHVCTCPNGPSDNGCNICDNTGKTEKSKFNGTPSKSIIRKIEAKDKILKISNAEMYSVVVLEYRQNGKETAIPDDIFCDLSLVDMNHLLYKCSAESKQTPPFYDCYHLDGWGQLPWAGFGFIENAKEQKDGILFLERLKENILKGPWLIEYLLKRLPSHWKFTSFFSKEIETLLENPSLIPAFIEDVYKVAEGHCQRLMGMEEKDSCLKRLAMSSVKLISSLPGTGLPMVGNVDGGGGSFIAPSMSAGIPHFAIDHWRVWGRDVFISLPGLLLRTGRFVEARNHIISFASKISHCIIPNLLDTGRCSRFNSVDSTFYFLYSIERYYEIDPSIMDDIVGGKSIKEIVFDIFLTINRNGIEFRDDGIDDEITEEGRKITLKKDAKTALLRIGNEWNCGTWMDKMGSSFMAGNAGHPATPRNGCPIEIASLLHRSLRWISNEYKVEQELLLWKEEIERNFYENFAFKSYFKDYFSFENTPKSITKSTQLRPNFIIAMAMNHDLFFGTPKMEEQSKKALFDVEKSLLGPIGIRTLSPEDPSYSPFYLGDESDNYETSLGFNYHNGPEWLWLKGLYITIKGRLDHPSLRWHLKDQTHRMIDELLFRDRWGSLPELTNRDGIYCPGSCPVQAWSVATFIDALMEID